jgi:hypothetical protein
MVLAVAAAGLIAACDGSPGDSLEVGGRKLDDAEQSDQSGRAQQPRRFGTRQRASTASAITLGGVPLLSGSQAGAQLTLPRLVQRARLI